MSSSNSPQTKKKVQTFRCKKGSNQNQPPTHTSAVCRQWRNGTLEWFNQAFFPPLVEVTVRMKYTIILFKRGLPVWGGVRVRRGEGWLFFKGKGWINRINKAGFLCLSSALSHRPDQRGAKCVSNCKRDQQIIRRVALLFLFCLSVWVSWRMVLSQSASLVSFTHHHRN